MGNKTSKLKRKQKNNEGKKKKNRPDIIDNGQVPEDISLSVGASPDDKGKNKQKMRNSLKYLPFRRLD